MDINTSPEFIYLGQKGNGTDSLVRKGAKGFTTSNARDCNADAYTLYNSICKKYPNVSFRIEEMEYDHSQKVDFHQSKKGFGNPGTVSIAIERNLLEHAASDKELAKRLIGSIDTMIYNYDNLTPCDEYPNMRYRAMSVTECSGELQWETTYCSSPFSTDQEINRQREEYSVIDKQKYQSIIQKAKQETLERLFEVQKNKRL